MSDIFSREPQLLALFDSSQLTHHGNIVAASVKVEDDIAVLFIAEQNGLHSALNMDKLIFGVRHKNSSVLTVSLNFA